MTKLLCAIICAAIMCGACSCGERHQKIVCLDYDSIVDTITVSIEDLVETLAFYPRPAKNVSVFAISESYICFISAGENKCFLVNRVSNDQGIEIALTSDERVTDAIIDERNGVLYVAHKNGLICRYELSSGIFKGQQFLDISVPLVFCNQDGSLTVFRLVHGEWRQPFCCANIVFDAQDEPAIKLSNRSSLACWPDDSGSSHAIPYVSRNIMPASFSLSDNDTLFSYDVKTNTIFPVFYVSSSMHSSSFKQIAELENCYLTKMSGVDNIIITSKKTAQSKFINIINTSDNDNVSIWNFKDGYYMKGSNLILKEDSIVNGVVIGKLLDFPF